MNRSSTSFALKFYAGAIISRYQMARDVRGLPQCHVGGYQQIQMLGVAGIAILQNARNKGRAFVKSSAYGSSIRWAADMRWRLATHYLRFRFEPNRQIHARRLAPLFPNGSCAV